jgi:hypothetical protein
MNEGILRLLMGDFTRGWPAYEWRVRATAPYAEQLAQPLWSGEQSLSHRTLLLYGEQGLGDIIQFCRYVPMVAGRAGRVVLEVPSALKALLGHFAGEVEVIAAGEARPPFDLHCSLLSLPRVFATTIATMPADVPYLSVPDASLEKWRARLPNSGLRRIGIVWAGNPKHKNDRNRSIPLREMLPLLAQPDATFFSLQKDLRAEDADVLRSEPSLVQLAEGMDSFADTAAIISLLDLVISVDTSVVHLAGALGKPVWVLLPRAPDWRWMLDRDDSPWYPTARLFRQTRWRDWSNVIGRVAAELSANS